MGRKTPEGIGTASRADYQAVVDALEVAKPDWYLEAEDEDKQFWGSLGFTPASPSHLLAEGKELEAVGLNYLPQTIAQTDMATGEVYVRERVITKRYEIGGPAEVAGVLVHEDDHSLEAASHTSERSRGRVKKRPIHGAFYQEGRAVLMEGLYRRAAAGPLDSPVSFDNPEPEIPAHYRRLKANGTVDTRYVAGPEGYAMELLAWGAERRGLLPAVGFTAELLKTLVPEARREAEQNIADTVNALRPDLYDYLGSLEYSRRDWRLGLRAVWGAVNNI